MNKPAPKEPSMDEILSSIRQIIADDDAAPARRATAPAEPSPLQPASPPEAASEAEADAESETDDLAADAMPLALSAMQIVESTGEEPEAVDFSAFVADGDAVEEDEAELKADFIDPEDIAFESEPEPPATPRPPAAPVALPPEPKPVAAARPVPPTPPPAATMPPARPRPTTAQAAPMPDPRLSADIAEELIEPATNAAVRANFARLNNLSLGNSGLTIEAMMREMLRPMLKEWLDEHLPAVVERMVEKEISRISRGVQ